MTETSQARRAEIAIAEAAEQWARQRSLTDRGCHPDFEEKAKATFLAELSRLTAEVADYQRREEWIKKAATSADEKIINLTAQVEGMSAPEGYVLVPVTDLTNVAAGIERHTQRESVSKVASDRMGEWSQQLRALAARLGAAREDNIREKDNG